MDGRGGGATRFEVPGRQSSGSRESVQEPDGRPGWTVVLRGRRQDDRAGLLRNERLRRRRRLRLDVGERRRCRARSLQYVDSDGFERRKLRTEGLGHGGDGPGRETVPGVVIRVPGRFRSVRRRRVRSARTRSFVRRVSPVRSRATLVAARFRRADRRPDRRGSAELRPERHCLANGVRQFRRRSDGTGLRAVFTLRPD